MATKQGLKPLQNRNFGSKIEIAKTHAKNVSTTHCSCSMQKTDRKKQLIFEKWDHFENCQNWPPSKGYSLCKTVTLAQKLKMQKNYAKNVSTTHCGCSMQKRVRQKQLKVEKWDHLENSQKWPPSKGYSLCKIVTLSQTLKMHKNMLKTFL